MNWRERTCGECDFWVKSPPDPNDLALSKGSCRHSLHVIGVLTPQGIVTQALYARGIEDKFNACGQFQPANIVLQVGT